jgi:thermitase
VHALVVTPDDDPLFDNTVDFPPVVARQYGLHEDYMNFEAAWASGWDGTDVIIAIVDSGVVLNHEDLVDNLDLANAFDFVQNDSVPQDGFGHGTHVAGIAAAVDNDKGGIGGAPEATILPIRVLGNTGSGGSDDVADGIDHAVANDADIINLSLGGTGCNNDIQLAIENALAAGVVVVAAGGNCGAGASLICPIKNAALYPAAGPDTDVIAVGATNESAVRANFSNWNPQKKYTLGWPSPSRYLDVAASGNVIGSTYIPNMDSYFNLSGTSMAAPYVSAAAALLIQKCGVGTPLTSRQVKLMLEATAEEIFGETTRIEFTPPIRTDLGYGLIQVGAAAALPCPA